MVSWGEHEKVSMKNTVLQPPGRGLHNQFLVEIFFNFVKLTYCSAVAMCDLVHNLETSLHLC